MNEPIRHETQLGVADLRKRLTSAGLAIIEQHGVPGRSAVFFAIGNSEHQTDIAIPHEFLDDLPNTKERYTAVDAYARAVAGRLKCGSPEIFYCRSGIAIRISIRWPIQSGVTPSGFSSYLLMTVTNQLDGQVAKCSMELGGSFGQTEFDIVVLVVNSVRRAIDEGLVTFYSPDVRQDVFQRINRQQAPTTHLPQSEVERFITGKAYALGFLTADEPNEIWTVDPWDAEYLGVSKKELSLASRTLRAKGLLDAGSSPEYSRPSDKLLAQQSSGTRDEGISFGGQQKLSRLNLPNKDSLLKEMHTVLERHNRNGASCN